MPIQINGLNDTQIGKIKAKVEQICTKNGIVSSWCANNFYILPSFDIYQFETVEGGMQNIYVVKAELSLSIRQRDGTIVNTITKVLKGSGNTKEKALTNCISSISVMDESFQIFLTEGKEKIVEYYNLRCSDICLRAKNYAQLEQYDAAIAVLMSVPEDVSCYSSILGLTEEFYDAYQDKLCAQITSAANAAIAIQDYHSAAELLTQINPNSSCYSFALNTFKKVEESVSAKELREWNFEMKQYNDSIQLERIKIDAIKEIAIAYYKNQPNINLQQFIK